MSDTFKINTNEYLGQCDSRDVVFFGSDKLTSISKLKGIVDKAFAQSGIPVIAEYIYRSLSLNYGLTWFEQGEECEILKAGSTGWQKGKIKINVTLEFIPDESVESKTDETSQNVNSSNNLHQTIDH
jgi:KGK domain